MTLFWFYFHETLLGPKAALREWARAIIRIWSRVHTQGIKIIFEHSVMSRTNRCPGKCVSFNSSVLLIWFSSLNLDPWLIHLTNSCQVLTIMPGSFLESKDTAVNKIHRKSCSCVGYLLLYETDNANKSKSIIEYF